VEEEVVKEPQCLIEYEQTRAEEHQSSLQSWVRENQNEEVAHTDQTNDVPDVSNILANQKDIFLLRVKNLNKNPKRKRHNLKFQILSIFHKN
jgi:hypothetical protein